MKKIYLLLLFVLLSSLNINYISADFSSIKNKSQINSEKAVNLLKKYVWNLKKELIKISEKYKIENDKKIKEKISRLNNIIYSINKIKEWKVKTNEINLKINNIIIELKSLNFEIKNYIKTKIYQRQKEVNFLKSKYSKKINILIRKLEKINTILTKKLNKNNLYKRNEYTRDLKKLNYEILELKKINSIKFNTKYDFWIFIKKRIINIKEQIIKLKEIIEYNKNR